MIFVLNTGLRRHEVLYLRWADLTDDSIMVQGKGNKSRLVPLNTDALAVLGRQTKTSQYVFDIYNRASPGAFRRVNETISRHIGVRFHIHLLRHAFATRLLASGADIITVSDLLGHGKFMTTLLYSHSSPGRMKQAVAALPAQERSQSVDTVHLIN